MGSRSDEAGRACLEARIGGDPTAMADAVARFARLCWRIIWLTPLAADPGFEARTAGLVAARPYLDRLGDGGSIESICDNVLDMASEKAA